MLPFFLINGGNKMNELRPRNKELDVLEGILVALGGKPVDLSETPTVGSSIDTTGLLLNLISAIKAPSYASVGIITATTSVVTGTTYVAFPNTPCAFLDIVNHTGFDIEYRRNGAGEFITIPTGSARYIEGITNANQISVRRKDSLTSAITVRAEAFVL